MQRHALTFRVRPGTQEQVRAVLADYPRPDTEVPGGARLLGTTVFVRGEDVIRVMDIDGPLPAVMRHLASQRAIRETEEALNPLLEQPRDLGDPQAVREFFGRAMMDAIVHRVTDEALLTGAAGRSSRLALCYPVLPGRGAAVAEILAEAGALRVGTPEATVLANTSVFRKADLVIRVAEFVGGIDGAEAHLARTVVGTHAAQRLSPLLAEGHDLTTAAGFRRFFTTQRLTAVTDRRAEEAVG